MNRLQKSQLVWEIGLEDSKINLKTYITQIYNWKWVKELLIYKHTSKDLYIIKCTFESILNIYFLTDTDKKKLYPNFVFNNNDQYIKSSRYLWDQLEKPVKYLDISYNLLPDADFFKSIVNPLFNTNYEYIPFPDATEFDDQMINLYYIAKKPNDRNVKLFLNYIINNGLSDRLEIILDHLVIADKLIEERNKNWTIP